ncbi:unnamed protein product [Leuciscus chuanchicus]
MLSQPEATCDLCTAKTSAEFHRLHTASAHLNGQSSFACGSDLAGGLRLLPGPGMRYTGGGAGFPSSLTTSLRDTTALDAVCGPDLGSCATEKCHQLLSKATDSHGRDSDRLTLVRALCEREWPALLSSVLGATARGIVPAGLHRPKHAQTDWLTRASSLSHMCPSLPPSTISHTHTPHDTVSPNPFK